MVWCAGVLYHSPYPWLTLVRLRELTSEKLVLATASLPEVPGVSQAMVLYPGLSDRDQALYHRWGPTAQRGLRIPTLGEDPYAPWWFGITPSALRGMLRAAGFEPEEEWGDPFGRYVVARAV